MNRLDLDISKYAVNELQDIFNVVPNMSLDKIAEKINMFKSTITDNENIGLTEKDNIMKFLENVTNKLCKPLGHTETNLTFSSAMNDMILDTPNAHPIIENPNALAGKNAKIYEGKNVNFNEYPPGFINPINVKTIKKVLNIDSRFRSSYYNTLSTNYHLDLPDTFKRVVNLRLCAFELPLSIHAINSTNNCFTVDSSNVDISYGNYLTPFSDRRYVDSSANITSMINNAIVDKGILDLSYNIDRITGKSMFTSTSSKQTIYFNRDCNGKPELNTPLPLNLGWLLGFRAGSYDISNGTPLISEGIINLTTPKYLYLCINDFTNAGNNSFVAAFNESTLSPYIIARIQYQKYIQSNGIYNFAVDDEVVNANREYFGPVDIQKLQLQIIDEYGRVVNLNNMDWSCSLVLDILYD
jgi:hypothetical protein